LNKRKCEACHAGATKVTAEEMDKLKPAIPDWEIVEADEVPKLTRTFKFRNFKEALDFTGKVGAIAEQEGHHPAILTEWGKVNVTWWTHAIKGLHINDFIMASKTDALS
jgi:4a-hydroxytetrahydrobiopterin dehydratase